MKKRTITLLLFIIFIIFSGCSYSDEQTEALERLDPLHLLTDNKAIFNLTKEELSEEFEKEIDLPDWAQQLPDGRIKLEHYEGCSEPILLGYSFLGSGKISSIAYFISDQFNTPSVIQDYPGVLSQIREDMITLYGDNFREDYPNTECESFDELMHLLEDNKSGHYTMSFSSEAAFSFNIGEGCLDGTMEYFDIIIVLQP